MVKGDYVPLLRLVVDRSSKKYKTAVQTVEEAVVKIEGTNSSANSNAIEQVVAVVVGSCGGTRWFGRRRIQGLTLKGRTVAVSPYTPTRGIGPICKQSLAWTS